MERDLPGNSHFLKNQIFYSYFQRRVFEYILLAYYSFIIKSDLGTEEWTIIRQVGGWPLPPEQNHSDCDLECCWCLRRSGMDQMGV